MIDRDDETALTPAEFISGLTDDELEALRCDRRYRIMSALPPILLNNSALR